jgi:hypothetical protein
MSLFSNLERKQSVEKPVDSLGGFQTLKSNVYDAVIAMAYVSKSAGGSQFIEFEFKLPEGKTHKETVYVTSGDSKGNKYTYERNGKEFYLPGYILADEICAVATEQLLSQQDSDVRLVEVYDFDTKGKVQKEFPILIDLIGKKLQIAIMEVKENKKEKVGNKWENTSEVKTSNQIDKAFNTEGLTTIELMDGETMPIHKEKWSDKNKGNVKDNYKEVAGGSGNSSMSSGSAKPKSLFNIK